MDVAQQVLTRRGALVALSPKDVLRRLQGITGFDANVHPDTTVRPILPRQWPPAGFGAGGVGGVEQHENRERNELKRNPPRIRNKPAERQHGRCLQSHWFLARPAT